MKLTLSQPRPVNTLFSTPEPAMESDQSTIIPDRAEFIDVLSLLRRGRVMVRGAANEGHFVLDGLLVYTAHRPLLRYGLIHEYSNPDGFPNMRYYKLSETGREFARRACKAWRQQSLWHRLAVRLAG
jgi:hypothetical protein